MPVELKSKRSSSKSAKRKSTAGEASKEKPTSAKRSIDNDDSASVNGGSLPEPVFYLGGKHRSDRLRAKHHERFAELTTVIGASNASLRALAAAEASATSGVARMSTSGATAAAAPTAALSSSLATVPFANAFPTLSVGYLARAMGLNVSEEQVASIIELVEEDGPSTGFVDKRKLEPVLVDALLTGTLGGPTLRDHLKAAAAVAGNQSGDGAAVLLERLELFTPSLCVRDDEATLYRAFQALDVNHKGYLEYDDLQAPMTTEGESFSTEEADEMWMAMRDPETDRVYYRDFADVLARE